MIPLFTTDHSIGKSILKFKPTRPNGPDSVIDIAKQHGLKKVFLLENRMHGFLDYLRYSEKSDFDFVFGLRLQVTSDFEKKSSHRINIFAKNNQGIKLLYKIYSLAFSERDGRVCEQDILKFWSSDDLLLAIPFYDSYVYYNNLTFENFIPDFSKFGSVTMFTEDNGLPFDNILREKVKVAANYYGATTQEVKSIYYKDRKDFAAYQVRRIIDARQGARTNSLSKPNLESCGSSEFSFESWLDHEKETV